jgi:flagellin
MVYQVNSNVTALNVYNNLGVHQAKSAASLARISSGLKAAGGGDVASQGTAATISASMQATQSNISQVQFAINQLQTADTVYGEAIALGQKALEAVNRGADASADFTALAEQVDAIAAGIAEIAANTEFNGAAWDAASANAVQAVTPDALTVLGPVTQTSAATVGAAITAVTTFINATVDSRAKNAGELASLQSTLQVLNSVASNELSSMSQAQDTDIAKEMMNLTSANIMTEAATAMLAQAMQMPNSVLKLLQ